MQLSKILLGGVAFVTFLPSAAQAQIAPSLTAEAVFELQNEYMTESDDPATDGYNNMFFRSELAPTLQFNENFYLDGVAVFENIQDRDSGEHNYFDNEGAFIEELKLNYENGKFAALVGKFNPAFGSAWDYGRGIWSEDFAEDYEITERLGVGASYDFGNERIGSHVVSGSSFFADTSLLSRAVVTSRDELDKDDGGASNTESLESFTLALEGEVIPSLPNLHYKLGYRNQAEGDADGGAERESGLSATLGYVYQVNENIELDGLVELVDINNFDATNNDNQYIYTSLITRFNDGWNVTLGYTARNIDTPAGDINDHLLQVSGGYDFGQGTTAEIGYRGSEEGGAEDHIIGGLIRHAIEF